jgi:ankyrin repeat domain-containing protein 50
MCHQVFRTSQYEAHRVRNPDRVEGTCQWVLTNDKYKSWLASEFSDLLWISADPGCGKSVLAKSLVDHELRSTSVRTTCYFFFKDDDVDQKLIENALCALIHQLLSQNGRLIKHALSDFRCEGDKLAQSYNKLWNILLRSASDPEAAEVVCILDAVDECEKIGRNKLIDSLKDFYQTSRSGEHNSKLKILVTSRPYLSIERRFRKLTDELPTIRLEGEKETTAISNEITLVIKSRVPHIGADLDLSSSEQSFLETRLLNVENRTYLWLHLILDEIIGSCDVSKSRLLEIISHLPDTVDKAYTSILEKSVDTQRTRKLLHIIVAAARPLTLKEMNIALAINFNHKTYIDLELDNEPRFEKTIRNLCGLFVTVVEGKIYLIHQTAKEFLVSQDNTTPPLHTDTWKHSLDPKESNFVLMMACIWYLLFDVFMAIPLVVGEDDLLIADDIIESYTERHSLLDYASKHWVNHFSKSRSSEDKKIMELVLTLFDTSSTTFMTWFQVYWYISDGYSQYPKDFTDLSAGSYFGLVGVVKLLIEKGIDLESKDSAYGRSPLWWAAEQGHVEVFQLLVNNGADLEAKDRSGQTLVWWAVKRRNVDILQLLSQNGANFRLLYDIGYTPLLWATEQGQDEIIQQLVKFEVSRLPVKNGIENGFDSETIDKSGMSSLLWAAQKGQFEIAKLLIENGSNLETKNAVDGRTPLSLAAEVGHVEVVQLLLEKGADLEALDDYDSSPLSWAASQGQMEVVELLLDHGANMEAKDLYGLAPLAWAIGQRHVKVVKLLVNNGADLESTDNDGWTPLLLAVEQGQIEIVRTLVQNGASLEATDIKHGRTPLSWAAVCGHVDLIELLIERAAKLEVERHESMVRMSFETRSDVNAHDRGKGDALIAASVAGHDAVVRLLLEKGANVNFRGERYGSALQAALAEGHDTLVRLLIEQGADFNADQDKDSNLLYIASYREDEALVRILLGKGANVNIHGGELGNALQIASYRGNETLVRLLLENGADVNAHGGRHGYALIAASVSGSEAVLRLLLLRGADISVQGGTFGGALQTASYWGHETVARLLLDKGADVNHPDTYGLTPLFRAEELRNAELIKMFLSRGAIANPKDKHGRIPSLKADRIMCDGCGSRITDLETIFHCHVCHGGDFDLCQACVDCGTVCIGENHSMIKRFQKEGVFIDYEGELSSVLLDEHSDDP